MINVSILNPNIVCKNTVDGLEISWDDLSSVQDFKKYHLLRKRYDYSTLATDGDIIYSGTDNSIKDIDIENGVSYYYTLWLVVTRTFGEELVDDYLTNNRFRKNIIVHKLSDSADKMYNSLPGVYLREDKKLPSEIPLPLYRYMQLIGYQFDKVENLVNLILNNIDIDVCDERFLPVIAKWLGVTYDWSLSVTDNRILIKLMIENYSRKGTYDGLLTLVQKISKSRVEILIDKTPVLNTASYEEIKQRRTVIVDIYIGDESNMSWVGFQQDKVLDIVKQNVPKKNAYAVRIVISFDYDDKYEKNPTDAYPNFSMTTSYIELYEKTMLDEKEKFSFVSRYTDNYVAESNDNTNVDNVNIKTVLDEYVKTVLDTVSKNAITFVSEVDAYEKDVVEKILGNIRYNVEYDTFYYDKQDVTFTGTRGVSYRSKNLRGDVKSDAYDLIYNKDGSFKQAFIPY